MRQRLAIHAAIATGGALFLAALLFAAARAS
jgi:hypothetical protein